MGTCGSCSGRPPAEQWSCSRELNTDLDCLNLHAGDIDWDYPHEECLITQDLGVESDLQYFRSLVQQYTQELEQSKTVSSNSRDKHDWFEIFVAPTVNSRTSVRA